MRLHRKLRMEGVTLYFLKVDIRIIIMKLWNFQVAALNVPQDQAVQLFRSA